MERVRGEGGLRERDGVNVAGGLGFGVVIVVIFVIITMLYGLVGFKRMSASM